MSRLLIRNAEVEGRAGLDVRLAGGRIVEIGPALRGPEDSLDARGGALIPGLIDHHIHLLATAARAESLALDEVRGADAFARRLAAWAAERPPGQWLRATGWHEHHHGPLDRAVLDRLAPGHPARVQDQTGALWVLNSAALQRLGDDLPEAVERGPDGAPTGRLWRADAWLRARLSAVPPPLGPLGARLAALGVTGVTDASVTTDETAARLLADAHRTGALPQRLMLMSGGPLAAAEDGAFAVGPLKILLDDRDLPTPQALAGRIALARRLGRPVAAHCVTAAELAVMLAALDDAGAAPGDRIEHGGVIAAGAIGELRRLGLTVVTQPAFVFERGDRYRAEVDPAEQDDLYRIASLVAAGVPVAASSDAPYADPDPWLGLRAAAERRTRAGAVVGKGERVPARRALGLYLGDVADPGGAERRVDVGARADLCLLDAPLVDVLAAPDAGRVVATLIDGRVSAVRGQATTA
ncbi:amidohydrolase family protein [Caulobacter sp. KR2-114]|uniref:amidohydrolase family protein n=1 Tax=Caulobacter sp. KR2-114 TaxID=3400912 RepID=UPI003C11891E